MKQTQSDFHQLSPSCILDAIEALGYQSNGRLLAMNSYENRVYQVGIEDGTPLVVKFYRPNRWSDAAILEEHHFVRELVEQEIPVVDAIEINNQTLHLHEGYRYSVFARHPGRAPELDHPGVLEWLGRFIGRIHAVGARTTYHIRPTINLDTYGVASRNYLLEHQFIPADLMAAYVSTSAQVLQQVEHCFAQVDNLSRIRLHGDCHLGNVLWTDAGPHFVDFDDSRMGPAIQDCWMLLSGSRAEMTAQLCDIVAGYENFCDFNPRELGLIEALRSLRLLHYSAWLAQRWADPAFKTAFPWFNTERYWQDCILELREQCAAMDEAPLQI